MSIVDAESAPPLHDLLAQELEHEYDKTRRVLASLPEGRNDFRPHAKSKTLIELANHLATVSGLPGTILQHSVVDLGGPGDPRTIVKEATVAGILEQFAKLSANSLAVVRASPDSAFLAPFKVTRADQTLVSCTRFTAYRNIGVNHMIHHRAQLGVYLRLLDIAVPATFGPSADEQRF